MNRSFEHRSSRPSRQPTGSGGPPGQAGPRTVADVWGDGYLRDGYFDGAGHLRLEYVQRDRVEPLVRAMANARQQPPLNPAQLRRFFQHCRRLESQLKIGVATWKQVQPQVLLLDAAAQDAFGKTPRKIPEIFFDFVRRNIAVIRTEDDFLRGFLPHFEALVGFGATHIRRERS